MNTKTKQGGLGIVSILTIVFIVLKLSGVIKWHWIWVLSPIWISALTAVILFAGILIGGRLKKGKWQYAVRNFKIPLGTRTHVRTLLSGVSCVLRSFILRQQKKTARPRMFRHFVPSRELHSLVDLPSANSIKCCSPPASLKTKTGFL